jgi:hypothetical protein
MLALGRKLTPVPQLPGLKHKIYKQQFDGYLSFMKKHFNP